MNKSTTVNPLLIKLLLMTSLFVLYVIAINFFSLRFTQLFSDIAKENEKTKALQQKSTSLSDSSSGIVTFTDGILLAMPQSDSSLFGINQIKSSASTAGLIVENISYSASTSIGQ